jgi:hypothetical protein
MDKSTVLLLSKEKEGIRVCYVQAVDQWHDLFRECACLGRAGCLGTHPKEAVGRKIKLFVARWMYIN